MKIISRELLSQKIQIIIKKVYIRDEEKATELFYNKFAF